MRNTRVALLLSRMFIAVPFALSVGGCSDKAGLSGSDADGSVAAADSAVTADMAGPATMRLITSSYMLAAGQEEYLCQRKTVTADVLIHQMIPVNGLATHHEVLGVDLTHTTPDGLTDCSTNVEFDVLHWSLLFASGVDSPTLTMPDGVAIHVHAGDQLVFQMHLLNASPNPVSSTASLDVVTLDPSLLKSDAQMLLAGPLPDSRVTPDIPVGPNQIVNGSCTIPADTSYFAVFPHMHQIGHHIKVTTTIAGAASTIYDADYVFNNQVFAQFPSLTMHKGDKIGVTCTYDNETGMPVEFGQSSYQEMCFAISYLYPPVPVGALGPFCYN